MHVLCNLLSAPVVKISPVLYSTAMKETYRGLVWFVGAYARTELMGIVLLVYGCSCSYTEGKA